MIPANAIPEVLALLKSLEPLFQPVGQLVAEAMKVAPELNQTPLPALDTEEARAEAVARIR